MAAYPNASSAEQANLRDDLTREFAKVPQHLREGLFAYVIDGRPTGDFLAAVLANDLRDAFARADDRSLAGLRAIIHALYMAAPALCHGSREKVAQWIALSGAFGQRLQGAN